MTKPSSIDRVTALLPKPLHDRLKKISTVSGVPVAELIRRAITEGLKSTPLLDRKVRAA